jgi:hypothetical protein
MIVPAGEQVTLVGAASLVLYVPVRPNDVLAPAPSAPLKLALLAVTISWLWATEALQELVTCWSPANVKVTVQPAQLRRPVRPQSPAC